ENKASGSLTHFFGGSVPKVNIHSPAGLDSFVDQLADGPPVILADMGAGSGQVTYDWSDKMYPDVADAGIVFTAIGVVTSDPASVETERQGWHLPSIGERGPVAMDEVVAESRKPATFNGPLEAGLRVVALLGTAVHGLLRFGS